MEQKEKHVWWSNLVASERNRKARTRERKNSKLAEHEILDEIAQNEPEETILRKVLFWVSSVAALAGAVSLFDFVLTLSEQGLFLISLQVFGAIGIIAFVVQERHASNKRKEAREDALSRVRDRIGISVAAYGEVSLSDRYRASGYKIYKLEKGSAFWSDDVSSALVTAYKKQVTRIRLISGFFDGGELRRIVGWSAGWRRVSTGRPFKNESKIRLLSDVLLQDGQLPTELVFQATDYVANLATNDLAFRRVTESKTTPKLAGGAEAHVLYDGKHFFLSPSGEYLGYPDSRCSNQIGISLFAFTTDGYLMRVLQQPGNIQSPNLVAPSGSGSFDWEDLETRQASQNDVWIWASRQHREFLEEMGLMEAATSSNSERTRFLKDLKIRSMPIGFGGYLHRSGKPEIFCLTRIHCNRAEIIRNSSYTQLEDRYSRIFAENASAKVENFQAETLKPFFERLLNERDKSVPLEMGYLMMLHLCKNKAAEIEEFLNALA